MHIFLGFLGFAVLFYVLFKYCPLVDLKPLQVDIEAGIDHLKDAGKEDSVLLSTLPQMTEAELIQGLEGVVAPIAHFTDEQLKAMGADQPGAAQPAAPIPGV